MCLVCLSVCLSVLRFYSKVKCWVDEPRLHEADLNLPSLPAQFDVPRLQEVFEPQIVSQYDLLYTVLLVVIAINIRMRLT